MWSAAVFRGASISTTLLLIALIGAPTAVAQSEGRPPQLRYESTTQGAVTITGNTLGLAGEWNQNGPGAYGSIGTFITTDDSSQDGTFPLGTTADWRQNGSEAELDLPTFRAAAEGYLSSSTVAQSRSELASLAEGIERLSLELCARFATDALCESYFAWDGARFASAGEHNLLRARGQLSLHRQAREARDQLCRFVLG